MTELTKTEVKWVIAELDGSIKEIEAMHLPEGFNRTLAKVHTDNLKSVKKKLEDALNRGAKMIRVR